MVSDTESTVHRHEHRMNLMRAERYHALTVGAGLEQPRTRVRRGATVRAALAAFRLPTRRALRSQPAG